MASVRYPVALHGIDVLNSWTSKAFMRAARESEAVATSGKSVQFVSEVLGPKFDTENAALDYYGAQYPKLLEDARPGSRFTPEAADRFARLMCRAEPIKSAKRTTPVMTQGQRWPSPAKPVKSVWQLSLSYWKIIPKRVAKPAASLEPYIQARAVRKKRWGRRSPLKRCRLWRRARSCLTARKRRSISACLNLSRPIIRISLLRTSSYFF